MSKIIEQLEIELVGPKLWQELLEQALAHSGAAGQPGESGQLVAMVRQVAEAIIAALHSRHVGVTPEAAVGLARLIVGEHVRTAQGEIWANVTDRLRNELRRTMVTDRTGTPEMAAPTGFVLRDAPAYTVLRLALPLFSAACAQIGRSLLACADETPAAADRTSFTTYQEALHQAVVAICSSDDDEQADPYALFWAEIALTYASGAIKPGASRDTPALPAVSPLALGWMLRMDPDPEPFLKEHGQPRVVTTPLKRQRSRRLNEGGVTGYKLTRRVEDLSGIVHTELINPDAIMLDRILNSGYLTIERPPRHQKRRHVLVIGMLPPAAARLAATDLVKACWFDCLWRFTVFLRSQELHRSEIRWIEGDQPDRARSASYLLEDLPMLGHDESFNRGDWWMFLKSLRWVPSFLNRRARPVSLPDRLGPRDTGPVEAAWCRGAWAVQRDNNRLSAETPNVAHSWDEALQEFAHVHLMIFLPAPPPPQKPEHEGEAESQGWRRMVSHFTAGLSADVHMSITWLPRSPLGEQPWRLVSSGRSVLIEASPDPRQIASRLEQAWLDRLIEDTCRE